MKLVVFRTLRWLEGGSHSDILALTGIRFSTHYEHIENILHLIDDALYISFQFNDAKKLREDSEGFSGNRSSPFRGCGGSLDGLAIKIIDPSRNYVPNPSVYHNRKVFFF